MIKDVNILLVWVKEYTVGELESYRVELFAGHKNRKQP